MVDELLAMAEMIGDAGLRGKVLEMLEVPDVDLEGEKLPFEVCPGGAYVHHAYEGGLVQHTLAVTRLCVTLCDLVEGVYGGSVDRDTVIAGALIHDVMKCYQYVRDGGVFRTSPLGERVDHLTLVVAELYRRGFPLEVVHVVASHHGDQSPVKPKTLEALIVSIADFADSELSRKSLRAAEYLLREVAGGRPRLGSSGEALELLRVKAEEGWDGVRRLRSGKGN